LSLPLTFPAKIGRKRSADLTALPNGAAIVLLPLDDVPRDIGIGDDLLTVLAGDACVTSTPYASSYRSGRRQWIGHQPAASAIWLITLRCRIMPD